MTAILINFLLLGLIIYFANVFAKSNLKTWVVIAFIYFCWSIINIERIKWVTYIRQEYGDTNYRGEFED